MDKIGLKNLTVFKFDKLKSEMLLFDEIHFSPKIFEQSIEIIDNSYPTVFQIYPKRGQTFDHKKEAMEKINSIQADVDFLLKNNLLKEFEPLDILKQNNTELSIQTKNIIDKSQLFLNEKIKTAKNEVKSEGIFKIHSFYNIISTMNDALIRASKIEMAKSNTNVEYLPILTGIKNVAEFEKNKKQEVVEMVLSKFPIPSSDVSWEKIIDFKNNEDAKLKLGRLRIWMNKMANSSAPISEIQEELEQLLSEYEHRMKLEKMKYNYSTVNLIFITTAEVLENLVALKFSKVAKTLINLRKRDLDLLIGETKAPGKEFAYLSKIKANIK
jgi:hypothetical protein